MFGQLDVEGLELAKLRDRLIVTPDTVCVDPDMRLRTEGFAHRCHLLDVAIDADFELERCESPLGVRERIVRNCLWFTCDQGRVAEHRFRFARTEKAPDGCVRDLARKVYQCQLDCGESATRDRGSFARRGELRPVGGVELGALEQRAAAPVEVLRNLDRLLPGP